MNPDKLNRFSRALWEYLSISRPTWLESPEIYFDDLGNFELAVLSPVKEEKIWLTISADSGLEAEGVEVTGEVTWGFDGFHTHSFRKTDCQACEWLEEQIDDLLQGKAFVASFIDNGRQVYSTLITKEQAEELKRGVFSIPEEETPDFTDRPWAKPVFEMTNMVCRYINNRKPNRVAGWDKIYDLTQPS